MSAPPTSSQLVWGFSARIRLLRLYGRFLNCSVCVWGPQGPPYMPVGRHMISDWKLGWPHARTHISQALFSFLVTPGDDQRFLPTLYRVITPGRAWGSLRDAGIDPGLTPCEANTLPLYYIALALSDLIKKIKVITPGSTEGLICSWFSAPSGAQGTVCGRDGTQISYKYSVLAPIKLTAPPA